MLRILTGIYSFMYDLFTMMTLSYCNCFVLNYILYYMYLAHVVALKKHNEFFFILKEKANF